MTVAEPEVTTSSLPVQSVATDTLVPHPRNAREGDVGAITQSLERFGQYRPIVVQSETPEGEPRNVIVAGTHTWRAAQALNWPTISAVMLVMPDELALRVMLADNRTHDLGRDRPDALAEILVELGSEGMIGTGWDAQDLDTILRDLKQYDPGAAILGDFAHLGEALSDRAELQKGRAADGTEFFALHVSLTAVQREAILAAFKRAKALGFATQPEALEDMARKYSAEGLGEPFTE